MKFFTIAVALGLSLLKANSVVTADCGEGKVAMAGSGLCIEPNYIEGCQSYENENECASCNKTYQLNNKRCDYVGGSNDTQTIPGCLVIDASGKCINCANGFRKVDGGCKLGIKHCSSYDQSQKCTGCTSDYSLVLGECRHNFLLGCRTQQPNHICNQCFAPFKLTGSSCSIPNCTEYNDFGCVSCACGYFLTSERNCKKMVEGCVRYQRGICINCAAHYKLKGGFCQIDGCAQYDGSSCLKCGENYQRIDGGCTFKNCYDWFDNKCLVCARGYRKQNDSCVKVTSQSLKCA